MDIWLRASPAFANVIARSRYAEDALHVAVARGVTQYVLIGAGFDSYALRTPSEAQHIDIYEVDHPATQTIKRRSMEECGLRLPNSVHFVAADLSKEPLAHALATSAFDSTKPAFFSWLGVTMYLSREANLALLLSLSELAAPGSELVFTYLDDRAFRVAPEPMPRALSELGRSVASVGEPFLSGFDPSTLAGDLRGLGVELEEDLDDFQLVNRYDSSGLNGLKPVRLSRIARARVSADLVGQRR
jgi:methyltransferase (TIGR00027 family)